MSDAKSHLAWAKRHRVASDAIRAAGTPDARGWSVVALFYAAAHLAHAVLATSNHLPARMQHPENHTGAEPHPGTNTILRTRFIAIWPEYFSLFSESTGVRYEGRRVDEASFEALSDEFEKVRTWARGDLAPKGLGTADWP